MTAGAMDPGRAGGLVVAVDGGGVKTDLALLTSDGGLLALVRGGGSSSHYLGTDGSVAVLEDLLESATRQAGIGRLERPFAAAAQFLLAGADLPEEMSALRAAIARMNWSDQLIVDNDTLALLRAGTERGWGVAVVCGAGINCLGLAPDGREVRFPSLGEISGDWGGGVEVGLAGLMAAARSADGRAPRSVLEQAVPAHFDMDLPFDVSRALHLGELPVARLGELAAVVFAAAAEDRVAAEIVERLTAEVIAFAGAAIRRLELGDADPDVVLGGGMLRALAPGYVEAIARGVASVAPSAHVRLAPSEPIVGAALLGFDAIGVEPDTKARARAELDAAVHSLVAGGPGDAPLHQVSVTLVKPPGLSGS